MSLNQLQKTVHEKSDWLRDCWDITPVGSKAFASSQSERAYQSCRFMDVSISPCRGQRDADKLDCVSGDGLCATFYQQGNLHFAARHKEETVGPGDLLIWDPTSPASFECDKTTSGKTIVFPKAMVENRIGGNESTFSVCAQNRSHRTAFLKAHILQVLALPADVQKEFLKDLLELTLDLIILCTERRAVKKCDNPYNTEIFDRVINVIRDNVSRRNFTLLDLSSDIGLSVRRIQNVLHERDLTFTNILKEERLKRAAQLLRSSGWRGKTITDIALELGYYDNSHFSNSFRSYYNMSPRQYRSLD